MDETLEDKNELEIQPIESGNIANAVQNEVTPPTTTFQPPWLGPGKSSVDLSIDANRAEMEFELQQWKSTRKDDPYYNTLKNNWYMKYLGSSPEEYRELKTKWNKKGGFYPGANDPFGNLKNTLQGLSTVGLGAVDFIMDSIGTLGASELDDKWDAATKLDNPVHQVVREMSSVVVPSMLGGSYVAGILKGLPSAVNLAGKAKWTQRGINTLAAFGGYGALETGIISLSDEGEEHNLPGTMAKLWPGVFGPKGSVPLPERITTLDSDSPSVRKEKNRYDTIGLSFLGTGLGSFIELTNKSKKLDWFIPKSDSATKFKQLEIFEAADPEDIIRLQEINTLLSTKQLSKQNARILEDELMAIEERIRKFNSVEDLARSEGISRSREEDFAAKIKVSNPDQLELKFDVDVSPGVLDGSSAARQTVPSANVARNIADTTAIKTGVSEGDPAPIMTEAMRAKGLMVGPTSRGAVMGVAEETRDIGRFDAVVDGFRFGSKQMNAAAWDIYTTIIDPSTDVADIKKLFLENKDVKNLLMGRFKVEFINEEQARAAAFGMRDLVDRFLGREVSEASARVMDTLGRESSTMAQAMKDLAPFVDDNRAMDLIIDKMQYLMDEYALNKYIAGWSLRNKNWFDQVPPKELDTVIEQLTKEFTSAENAIHAKNLRFTQTLKQLKETNPLAMRPLVDAYAHTNGDVDSLAKLYKWAAQQVTPMGMLKSPNPKELNLFARGAWGVVYNNVLSGLSAFRAGVGNTAQLILKPITGTLGHSLWGFSDGFEGLKMSMYANGAMFETNRRALSDAFQMMKKAHKDPELMMKAYRKDFQFKGDTARDILQDMRKVWEAEGNWGRVLQHDMSDNLRKMAEHPALRYGMTGMVFPDVFTTTHLAHYLSRMKAYDEVFYEFGFSDWKKIAIAEKKHYKSFFDDNGIIKDDVLRSIAGEVQLNLDDGLANWLNQGTTAYPITKFMMMFPRTSSNYIKNSASWTPISLIPGINKYSKTLYARTDDDIAEALMEHGIDMLTTPNARIIFKNLRAEYTGRLAFSSLLAGSLWQYAMAGNIRGNGHYNASRRKKERDNFGYDPKTINIGGKWVSYKGILGVEQVLSIIGDLAYYSKDVEQPFLEDSISKLSWTLAATFLNETPLQGLEPLIAATNGDLTGWSRLIANSTRAMLPLSGGAGVVANAISSSQKDLEGSVVEYVQNRIPIANALLPEQIDFWTGEPLNDIDNPYLRMLNALSPMQVSGTNEPWREWLRTTGWRGFTRLTKDSSGSYEYNPKERELILRYMGEMELYKQLIPLMKSKYLNEPLEKLRLHRLSANNISEDDIKIKASLLPLYKELNKIVRTAQIAAEQRLINERPDIAETIFLQREADDAMKKGNTPRAIDIQEITPQRIEETRQLLSIPK